MNSKREAAYQITMQHLRRLLRQGIISAEEYEEAETLMRKKYNPTFTIMTCYNLAAE